MNKKEIISLAESMGFELEYDKFYDNTHPADIYPSPPFMLFVHKDGPKGKKAVKWVWLKEEADEENIANGNHILNFINQTA